MGMLGNPPLCDSPHTHAEPQRRMKRREGPAHRSGQGLLGPSAPERDQGSAQPPVNFSRKAASASSDAKVPAESSTSGADGVASAALLELDEDAESEE